MKSAMLAVTRTKFQRYRGMDGMVMGVGQPDLVGGSESCNRSLWKKHGWVIHEKVRQPLRRFRFIKKRERPRHLKEEEEGSTTQRREREAAPPKGGGGRSEGRGGEGTTAQKQGREQGEVRLILGGAAFLLLLWVVLLPPLG